MYLFPWNFYVFGEFCRTQYWLVIRLTQPVSVSCGYWQQILHIWSGSGGYRKLITYGHPYTCWVATLKSDLSLHNLTFEDAVELALDKSLWRLLVASRATH